jgi:membrane-bound lytic murein transglycosylase B
MRILALLLAGVLLAPPQEVVEEPSRPFDAWLGDLIADARSRGFEESLLDQTLAGLQPLPRVVERDRSQAELTITLDRYFQTRITPGSSPGAATCGIEQALLRRIKNLGPSSVVLAIWGLESHSGGTAPRPYSRHWPHLRGSRDAPTSSVASCSRP